MAAETCISLASVSGGSGFEGSITAKDLDKVSVAPKPVAVVPPTTPSVAAPIQATAGQKYTDLPVTNIRGVIAKRLLQSKQSIPHYYLTVIYNNCALEYFFFHNPGTREYYIYNLC